MTRPKTLISTTVAGLALALALALPAVAQAPAPSAGAMTKSKPAMKSDSMTKAAPKAAPLDINSASKAELQALKGVGDKRADDIIKGRPYSGKDDLVQKKILPQGVYDAIKDKIIAKQK